MICLFMHVPHFHYGPAVVGEWRVGVGRLCDTGPGGALFK